MLSEVFYETFLDFYDFLFARDFLYQRRGLFNVNDELG